MNDPMDDEGGVRDRLARFAMLPLRLLLGLTCLHAGLGSFTDGGPFSDIPPRSVLEDALARAHGEATAPWLVDLTLDHPEAVLGAVVLGQFAVGTALLLGLLTRLAAVGGVALTLYLWLTALTGAVGPYPYAPELPYLAGFLALVLGGAGALSLDARARRRDRYSTAPAAPPPDGGGMTSVDRP